MSNGDMRKWTEGKKKKISNKSNHERTLQVSPHCGVTVVASLDLSIELVEDCEVLLVGGAVCQGRCGHQKHVTTRSSRERTLWE